MYGYMKKDGDRKNERVGTRRNGAAAEKCLGGTAFSVLIFAVALLVYLLIGTSTMRGYASSVFTAQSSRLSGPAGLGTVWLPRTDNTDLSAAFNGGEVRVLADETTNRQQLSMIIKSSDGKIVVVDGGVKADSEHLINELKELGGYVDAWLITHPQDDHVGALLGMLKDGSEIDIRNIYFSFHELSWYESVDDSSLAAELIAALSSYPEEDIHCDIGKGTKVTLSEELSFTVLNDPIKYEDPYYTVNNSGLMYDIELSGKHIIVLGDMGPYAGDLLLSEGVFDGLSCDYVQMSHHGQNGVSREVYEKLAPKACIWPAPSWLYDVNADNENNFLTYETKMWISQLGVIENYCTKNGDVTIR